MKDHDNRLGERKIIEVIEKHLEKMPNMPIEFGDDVSAVALGNDRVAVLKTDMLFGKTDVPQGMSLWQAARKAVVMNVSDFAAKGVKPEAGLVALGLPRNVHRKDVVQIAKGLNAGARENGLYLIGGDTAESTDLTVSIMMYGSAKRSQLMLRKGAHRGDLVAVTGTFGKTASGLKILREGLEATSRMSKVLVDSVLMPKARLEEGLTLKNTKAVTSSVDTSDGLAWSLHEISRASHVGFEIKYLPASQEAITFADENKLDIFELVFYGGEEYELVFTVKPDLWNKLAKALKRMKAQPLAIGRVVEGSRILFKSKRKKRIIEPRGYEHFIS